MSNHKQAIQTAIVAFGLSGKAFHAPFIAANPTFRLRKVVERHREDSASIYPEVAVCRSLNAVLEDAAIELVVITTPNTFHYSMARQALEAGKHVVLEKPFTVTLEEAQGLIQLAKEQQKMLTVFHNRRWDGDFLTVKQLLDKKMIGKPVEFESNFHRFRPRIKDNWREEEEAGSGILYDLGPHLIDQALCLFGTPKAVFADVRQQRPEAKTADSFELLLDYEHLKVKLNAGTLVRIAWPRFTVNGTAGGFIKWGLDPQEAALRAGLKPVGSDWGREEERNWGTLHTHLNGLDFKGKIETFAGNYGAFYQNVYEHIRKEEPLVVKPVQALEVMKLLELATRSAAEGKKLSVEE
ncbi:oxidoreductase [Nafulsella turpanensis]|uniref:oxidoreductase n=1 Tax=Nafulsella turpanensis TaxID=1265690 RepID=UPI00034BD336|nr:oxidoreductase [Nafulsella turpanensis]